MPGVLRRWSLALLLLGLFALVIVAVSSPRRVFLAERDSCREMVLDPDPTAPAGMSGTLHLSICPGFEQTSVSLWVSDALRHPPLLRRGILDLEVASDARLPPVPIRAHWITPDSLFVEYDSTMRVWYRTDTIGSIRVRFLARGSSR
ncbi:MAG TPA: hypothetical protein VMG41_15645 [Gemmatimonadales bacterium]|nr:hypothetical protein [Gemmatimonadales bacterium]